MVGPKMHHCGMCERSFASKGALNQHMEHHPEASLPQLHCETCNWPFEDSLALEHHKLHTGHGIPELRCDNCSETFQTQAMFNKHRKFPSPCADAFRKKTSPKASSQEHESRRPSAYVDLDAPEPQPSVLPYDRSTTPSNVEGVFCHNCRKEFETQAQYNRHALWCSIQGEVVPTRPPLPQVENVPPQPAAEAPRPKSQASSMYATLHHAPTVSRPVVPQSTSTTFGQTREAPRHISPAKDASPRPSAPPPAPSQAGTFLCNLGGCQKQFKSEAGLKTHQTDTHGIGGKGLDLHGKDSWMLSQRVREQLKNQGLLKSAGPPSGPPPLQRQRSPRKSGRGGQSAGPIRAPLAVAPPMMAMHAATSHANTAPTVSSIGGLAEMDQANYICSKILRLLVQTDISIQHDGKIICGGIAWTRIGVVKQLEVVVMLNKLTHLPLKLQGKEYLPPPKTFKDEYQVDYPATDFQHSPDRHPDNPRFGVVAVSCSKIVLDDGRQEVVKIAAVDVLACRILMHYLICTDPKASVKDWKSDTTGLTSFRDIEAARQAGYKVLKGWRVARSALWKFIDKETILIGHNLRSDLNALRMIHGRAIDVAKCVEKAAGGPLSKAQLSLDSLCRDYTQVHLPKSSKFGRDCLQDAFAAREFSLWILKQEEAFSKKAKQKSQEYQRVLGV